MSAALKKQYYLEEEYLELEVMAEYRSEYYQGEFFKMVGGTPNHNAIKENLSGQIYNHLRNNGKKCRSYSSDQRLHIPTSKFYTYPDLMVICGENKYAEKSEITIINPILIVEVLSKSTQEYDRLQKFDFYREIEGFKEYLIVDSMKILVLVYSKTEEGVWQISSEARERTQTIYLRSIDLTFSVQDMYDNTNNIPSFLESMAQSKTNKF